jgi:hypothetical protein
VAAAPKRPAPPKRPAAPTQPPAPVPASDASVPERLNAEVKSVPIAPGASSAGNALA